MSEKNSTIVTASGKDGRRAIPFMPDPRKPTIEEHIETLTKELTDLAASHDKMVNEHNARCEQIKIVVNNNLVRMHQLKGGITALTELLNQ